MKKSATLVELLVAAVIISLVLAAVLATFLTVKAYVYRANKRTVSTNLSRSNAYPLAKSVSADWDDAAHELSTGTKSIQSYSIDNTDYGDAANPNQYQVDATTRTDSGGNVLDYREVDITINYPE